MQTEVLDQLRGGYGCLVTARKVLNGDGVPGFSLSEPVAMNHDLGFPQKTVHRDGAIISPNGQKRLFIFVDRLGAPYPTVLYDELGDLDTVCSPQTCLIVRPSHQ